jgi:hypothetical protein
MRYVLLLAMIGLMGAAPGGCGGSEPAAVQAPEAYVCADPCPGATVVATMTNGQLFCLMARSSGGQPCSFVMSWPKTPDECVATAAYWVDHHLDYCW